MAMRAETSGSVREARLQRTGNCTIIGSAGPGTATIRCGRALPIGCLPTTTGAPGPDRPRGDPSSKRGIMNAEVRSTAGRAAYALFTILVLAAATGNLSQTAVNAMMTSIASDFGVEVGLAQWLTTIYILGLGISVPLSNFLWRRMGNRGYTMLTLSLFLIGALIDFAAPGFWTMFIGRVFQAVSAGFSTPIMQNVAMESFPPEKHGTMMGIAGIAMGFAPNIGPTIGGLFVDSVGWRWFFILLAAIALVLMAFTLGMVRDGDAETEHTRLDFGSFLLCAIGFCGLLAGLTQASSDGFASIAVWVAIVIGIICLVLFITRQSRTANPLIHMQIFESRKYKAGFWMQNFLFSSFMGITLVLPLYIEGALGGTATESGIVLLPGAIAALIFNPLSGVVGDRIGKTRVIRIAAAICTAGALLALTFDESSPIWYIALCQGIRGIGVSSSIGCAIAWTLDELPDRYVGDGSSFSLLVRQASSSFGTAIMVFLVTVLSGVGGTMLPYRCAFGFSAALAVTFLVLSLVFAHEDGKGGAASAGASE